jgi:hypothetical protein
MVKNSRYSDFDLVEEDEMEENFKEVNINFFGCNMNMN